MLRMEAAADDLLQRKNLSRDFQATLRQLNLIVGRDTENTKQSPISEAPVCRLLYTSAPENTSFGKIISQLSSALATVQQSLDSQIASSNQATIASHSTKNDPDLTTDFINDGQKAVPRLIDDYLIAEAASKKGVCCKPEPSLSTAARERGKRTSSTASNKMPKKLGLSIMTCAYTGKAGDNLPKGSRTNVRIQSSRSTCSNGLPDGTNKKEIGRPPRNHQSCYTLHADHR